ncbi:MAG: AAA family ATPase [Microscillaceae bacterium]|nr:AAA family ATPase [Microscillaceae bacterium]
MKLKVRNLGPIQKGEIDLSKRFYVFVGYNNSGKTYMSQLLWTIFEKWGMVGDIFDLFQEKADTYKITQEHFTDVIHKFQNNLKENWIPEYFNVEKDHFLIKNLDLHFLEDFYKSFYEKAIIFPFHVQENGENKLSILGKNAHSDLIYFIESPDEADMPVDSILIDGIHFNGATNLQKYFSHGVCKMIFQGFNDALPHITSHLFLPSNRNFFPTFYKYIFSASKEEKDRISQAVRTNADLEQIRALSKSSYTKAVDDLINRIYNLNNYRDPTHLYDDLLEELKPLIGGEIVLNQVEGIAPVEFSLNLDKDRALDMYLASSTSNQLATLYLYFKYWAKERDNFLMMDEPEENLHPAAQIKLLDILMRFADRNNNRVLITTHSPLMSESVNNHARLVYLQEQGEDVQKIIEEHQLDIHPHPNLKYEDFGVYFFNGKEVRNYSMHRYGAYFEDFEKAEDQVRAIANVLKDHIYQSVEE